MSRVQTCAEPEARGHPLGEAPSALGPRPSAPLESLLDQRSDLWRGRTACRSLPAGVPTGFPALDAALSWGGWPQGSLSELLAEIPGVGLGLVLPALARLGCEGRWLLLVDPPWPPYAPALAARGMELERLVVVRAEGQGAWAAEQGLRSGSCAAVLLWGGRWDTAVLRRLQLAAETGGALAFLFRDPVTARGPSPAPLRLQVVPIGAGYRVEVIKQRGGRAGALVSLGTPSDPTFVGRASARQQSLRMHQPSQSG
ncbi:MAG: translesion DNA synthesis-associated protein ImuA [Bdellovibrio bacteriovorus]